MILGLILKTAVSKGLEKVIKSDKTTLGNGDDMVKALFNHIEDIKNSKGKDRVIQVIEALMWAGGIALMFI